MLKNQFCFPIVIELNHGSYFSVFLVLIHVITLLILVLFTGKTVLLVGIVLVLVSLRLSIERQSTLAQYCNLIGIDEKNWFLVREDGRRSAILLKRVQMIGPFLFIAIQRYGETTQWITRYDDQKRNYWHRMKVFIGFYL